MQAAPTVLDRIRGAAILAVALLVVAGYLLGGSWRSLAEIGYTLGLAGIVGLWLWMLLTPGKWEQTMSEGQKLWGRFEPLFSQFLAKRIVGWALVAVIGSNVIVRTVGHLT